MTMSFQSQLKLRHQHKEKAQERKRDHTIMNNGLRKLNSILTHIFRTIGKIGTDSPELDGTISCLLSWGHVE